MEIEAIFIVIVMVYSDIIILVFFIPVEIIQFVLILDGEELSQLSIICRLT